MDTHTATGADAGRPAYCSFCRGVLPFRQTKSSARLGCTRCGTIYRVVDPGAETRRRGLRYLLYGSGAGSALAWLAAAMAAVGADHPLVTWQAWGAACAMAAMTAGCLARSLHLMLAAADFESLEPYEVGELDRRLCPGMVRSDIVDELFRVGWRPRRIRTAIARLRPVTR